MSEVVDRVAEAICDAGAQSKHKLWAHFLEDAAGGDKLALEIIAQRRLEARLAIAAMREPTRDMLAWGEACDDFETGCASAHEHWTAMIDAALSESVPASASPSGIDLPDFPAGKEGE